MAGMVPAPGKSSGRKQWTLHDGPRGSLRRLRNQLAEDGCPESQVVLAKQLLEERCELDIDKTENARIAVYWLIKSSEQGHEEATQLLEKCFRTGKGINEHNYLDVKSCINMTQDEKLARKAAREMFASLSNGEDFITSDQLQKRMIEIYKSEDKHVKHQESNGRVTDEFANGKLVNNNDSDSSDDEIDWTNRVETKNEKLTEENLVAAAVHYAHGELPLVNRVLCLTEPNPRALDHIPYFHRSILHPFLTFRILYYKSVRMLGGLPYFSFFPIAKSNVQLLLFILVYSLFGTESLVLFLPMALYYLSFVTMVVTTFQMMQTKHEFQDFRVWSGLFLLYSGGSLNAEEAEFQFIRNNLKPYGQFFLALLINLIMYPAVAAQWIPESEFTVAAFCLTFLSLITFMKREKMQRFPGFLLLLSFGLNVLARYPYESDAVVTQGWRFLDLKVPSFTSYVIGNGIEFCLNFRAVFFLVIPICFVKIAMREKGRGIYKFLIPHCVTLSWLQIVIISSQGATMYGLLRGTLALVGVVLFLPLAGLASMLIPIVAVANYVYESDYLMTLVFVASFGFCLIVASWVLSYTKYGKFITLFQICWCVLTISVLLATTPPKHMKIPLPHNIETMYSDYNIQPQERTISWEQYQNYCHQPSWEDKNMAATQLKCAQLEGSMVHWEGYISDIKITSIDNMWKTIFDKLPILLRDKLYCLYGQEYENNCSVYKSYDECQVFNDISKSTKCHMEYWNKYEFEISIKILSGVWGKGFEVALITEHGFQNFTLGLKLNDKIWFNGYLTNAFSRSSDNFLGGPKPNLKLTEIGCIACHNNELTDHKLDTRIFPNLRECLTYFWIGIKCVCNFMLNPIVLFK